MASRIVTVFGGSGFLGRHIVTQLAKDGWRIRVAVTKPHMAEFLRPRGLPGQVQPFYADVTDAASVARAIENSEAVVNAVGMMPTLFSGCDAINIDGARIVAETAAALGVTHLVHLSALGASAQSNSVYARSKAAGEEAVQAAFPSAAILRPSLVFGPEDQFFNRFANMARFTLALPLIGAETRFQPVYAADVGGAVRTLLDRPAPAGGVYELGGPDIMTMRQMITLTLRVAQRKRVLLPLPAFLAKFVSYPLSLVPGAPLTPDQVTLLQHDCVVSESAKGFADLGIEPDAAETVLPGYLWRFRKTGQFEPVQS